MVTDFSCENMPSDFLTSASSPLPARPSRLAGGRNWSGLFVLLLLPGCAGGPAGLARFNPSLRDEWKKDEAYGHTMHQRLEELQAWGQQAPQMSAERRREVAQTITTKLGQEANVALLQQSAWTLGRLQIPEADEGLKLLSEHASAEVRTASCLAWRYRGGNEAREALARILNSDTDGDVRVAAARQLGYFRDPESIAALGIALDDPSPALQYRAVESLKRITGENYGDDAAAWREFVAGGQAKPGPEPSWAERMVGWWW
jgi:hypothetical protein